MTLGSGAYHSEQNASADEPMRFIQIWILPNAPDLPPEVEQQVFTRDDRTDNLLKVIGPEGGQHIVKVNQDASVYVSRLNPGIELTHRLGPGRGAYVYLIDGEATLDDEPVATGDAAKVADQDALHIQATAPSELILVDVPLDFKRVGIWAGRG
jgi:redox-sensitive bicupin YhaK (pirin superfamily)